MKYLIVVPDGAADEKIESLGNKTPLEVAEIDFINSLAGAGEVGLVRTIPPGIAPGSDAANLSVMGYDPSVYLTGRSPLEAASIGIEMADTDVAFRTNIITLAGDGDYDDLIITDHSAGDISTEEAHQLIEVANEAFADEQIRFYTGVSYRHCLIVHHGREDCKLTPPHDVLGRRAGDFLPQGEGASLITDMMKKSYELFKDHPINIERKKKGLNAANTLWIWGQGRKPALSSFYEKYHIEGVTISAVDLIKGIGVCAGLDAIDVPGATGTIHTNYDGKAQAAIGAFQAGRDFVYLHVEGPDECSHQGDVSGKMECLKLIDQKIVKPIAEYLQSCEEDFRILIVPDHRTPIRIRTHSSDPVPFVLYDSRKKLSTDQSRRFTEEAGKQGRFFNAGFELADYFFEK